MKGSPIRPSTRYQVKHLCLTPKYLLSLLLGNVYDDDKDENVQGNGGSSSNDRYDNEDTKIENKEEQVENKDEDYAKDDKEIKKETKAVRNAEELEEKEVLEDEEENDIVNNEEEQKKTKKRERKNIFLGWLCGKIIKVFVKGNVLLQLSFVFALNLLTIILRCLTLKS